MEIMNRLKALFRNESGVTTVEYALIAALMAAAITGAFSMLSTALNTAFTTITGHMTASY
jgi:pilus assembly protein Flp/PilA